MKKLIIPVVISTLIISQIIPIHVSANPFNDTTSTSEASLGSGETSIGEITMETTDSDSESNTETTDSDINNDTTSTSEASLGSGETIDVITVETTDSDSNSESNTETTDSDINNDTTSTSEASLGSGETTIGEINMESAPLETSIGSNSTNTLPQNIDYTIESNNINTPMISITIIESALIDENTITYTPWELIHKTFITSGFVWTGLITHYITPAMSNTHTITHIGSR